MLTLSKELAEARLEDLREKFSKWRSSKVSKWIPDEMWSEAAQLAEVLGVVRVAGKLNIWRPKLERLLEKSSGSLRRKRRQAANKVSFLEVPLIKESPTLSEARFLLQCNFFQRFLKIEWR